MPRDTAGQSHVGMFERVTDSKGVSRSPRSGVGDDVTYDDGTKTCNMRMSGDQLSMRSAYNTMPAMAYNTTPDDMADDPTSDPTPTSSLKTPSPPRSSSFQTAQHRDAVPMPIKMRR